MPCVYKKIRDGVLDGLMLFVRRFFYLCACDISSDLANQSLLIVAPHPDDDILGCGAVIARACENKQNVHVVIVTDGRASSPSKTLSQSDLIALRKKEAVHALSVLGCGEGDISFLGYMDGTTDKTHEELRRDLLVKIETFRPQIILTPHPDDQHADHQTVTKAVEAAVVDTMRACRILYYPIWFWPRGAFKTLMLPVRLLHLRRAVAGPWLAKKQQAMLAHRSQCENITGEADWQFLSPRFIKRFMAPYELFFEGF